MRNTARRGGFSLIEVLIAATVLAMATAALAWPFSIAAEHQRLDARQATAVTLATQRMERMLRFSFDDLVAFGSASETGLDITGADGRPLNDPSLADYTLTTSTQTVEYEGGTYCVVRITVEADGLPATRLARLVAPGGAG